MLSEADRLAFSSWFNHNLSGRFFTKFGSEILNYWILSGFFSLDQDCQFIVHYATGNKECRLTRNHRQNQGTRVIYIEDTTLSRVKQSVKKMLL